MGPGSWESCYVEYAKPHSSTLDEREETQPNVQEGPGMHGAKGVTPDPINIQYLKINDPTSGSPNSGASSEQGFLREFRGYKFEIQATCETQSVSVWSQEKIGEAAE